MTPVTPSPVLSAAPATGGPSFRALTGILVAAVLCSAALAAGVMGQMTWSSGQPDVVNASVRAVIAVLLGTFVGVGLFAMTAGRTPASAPLGLLAGSMVRMLTALSIALLLYFTGGFDKPTGTSFWIVFLACGLAAIVAETAWGMKNLPRFSVHTNPPAPSAAAETH